METFKFEVTFSKTTTRIWRGFKKTKYYAGGYGYDKLSTVIAEMINDLTGEQTYSREVYGHYKGLLTFGVGFDATKQSFESIEGNKLDLVYCGKTSNVYEITFA